MLANSYQTFKPKMQTFFLVQAFSFSQKLLFSRSKGLIFDCNCFKLFLDTIRMVALFEE